MSSTPTTAGEFQFLRRFVQKNRAGERCDLCSTVIANEHSHLLALATKKIICSCRACALLFSGQNSSRYKQIPRDAVGLSEFQLDDGEWDSLSIPIGLAFFFFDSQAGKVVAFYPSPAGATESLLDLKTLNELPTLKTLLDRLQPDVEALLVNRIGAAREYYIAPIDDCYKLVGLIRTNWRGLSGGQEVWDAIDRFFRELVR